METSTFIVLGIIAVVVVYFVIIYNNLVRLKHNVSQAWSNIDVMLKQRHDEIPKLVTVCQEYMGYEKSALEDIIKARSAVASAQQSQDIGALGKAETQMRLGLGNLFALAEQYPDLKANQSFQNLQTRISSLESAIADRRELYNSSVNLNNIRIEQFPDVIIAKKFNFGAFDLLEFEDAELKDVNIKALFNS